MNTIKKNFLIVTLKKWHHENFHKIKKKNFFLIKNKNELKLSKIKKINPKYIFFPHWSYKIKSEILDNFYCIGFHETDLPYGRGGSPIQNLIIRNKKKTKISAFKINNTLDAGDIIMKRNLSLKGSANEIYTKSSDIIFNMINIIINKVKIKPVKQKGKPIYFKRLKNNSISISKGTGLRYLYNKVRMLDAQSYEKAHIILSNKFKIEFSNAKLIKNTLYCNTYIKKIHD